LFVFAALPRLRDVLPAAGSPASLARAAAVTIWPDENPATAFAGLGLRTAEIPG
jgi:hypothetical protein